MITHVYSRAAQKLREHRSDKRQTTWIQGGGRDSQIAMVDHWLRPMLYPCSILIEIDDCPTGCPITVQIYNLSLVNTTHLLYL